MEEKTITRRYGFLVMAAALLLARRGKKDAGSAEQTAKPASGEAFTLKIGSVISDIDLLNVAHQEFKGEVEKASEGHIQVELLTSDSIGGTNADVLDKVRSNTPQMDNTTPGCLANLSGMSEYYIYGIPYLMPMSEELDAIAESEWFMGLNEDFTKATGVKASDGEVNMGWPGSSATDKEICQIADSKGMTVRINQTNQATALSESVGINPQFITFSEVYIALAQGIVDDMVTSVPLSYSSGFYDQLKNIPTTHCEESHHFYITNDKFYNSFPDDLKPIIDKNADRPIAKTRELEVDYLEEAIGRMREKNVIVTEASREDEDMLRQTSVDKVWQDENVSLTSKENVKKVLEILGRIDETQ